MKLGLVIAGPISSRHKPEVNAYFGKTTEPEIFDSSNTIIQSYLTGRQYFSDVVFVTWQDGRCNDIQKVMDSDDLIVVPQRANNNKVSSKFLQMHLVKQGLIELSKRHCEFSAKIRSDQSVDLNLLSEFMLLAGSNPSLENRLCVPYVHTIQPAKFIDFYFSGKTRALLTALQDFEDTEELYPDTHMDLFYKLSAGYAPDLSGEGPSWRRLPKREDFLWYRDYALVKRIWSNIFLPMDAAIWCSVIWRGDHLKGLPNYYSEFSIVDGQQGSMELRPWTPHSYFRYLITVVSSINIKRMLISRFHDRTV